MKITDVIGREILDSRGWPTVEVDIVLDDGKISAVGTHEELLINNEIYADVYNSQMKGDEEEYEIAR